MKLAGFIFCVIGTVLEGIFIIPLAWCIPLTVKVYRYYKYNAPLSSGFLVCITFFVSLIGGLLLACDTDNNKDTKSYVPFNVAVNSTVQDTTENSKVDEEANSTENSEINTTSISTNNTTPKAYSAYTPKKDSVGAWWLLGFFFPLIGLILFLNWNKTYPKKAKSVGIGAIVGAVFYNGLIFINTLIGY